MPKNILFVVDNLVMGGITKVITNLLVNLDSEKYNIDLLVLHYYEDMNVKIPEYVNIIEGNKFFSSVDVSIKRIMKEKNVSEFLKKLSLVISLKSGRIRNKIVEARKNILTKKYDTEIAFSDGFSHIFVANGDTPNKIAWMHTDISVQNDSKRYYNLVKESLKKMNMSVCVSDRVREVYKSYYDLDDDKIQTIHNIIDVDEIKNKGNEKIDIEFSKDVINLISVGRLESQKNYERFINVHKKLIDDGYKINSYLIGDGLDKEKLENTIKEQKIEDTFFMLGRKDNPFPYVKKADLFILSSILEGLPTVLYESIILGVPCVSTEVAGAREILKDKYGLITKNDDEALYCGIKKVLDDKKLLDTYKSEVSMYKSENSDIIRKVEKII